MIPTALGMFGIVSGLGCLLNLLRLPSARFTDMALWAILAVTILGVALGPALLSYRS